VATYRYLFADAMTGQLLEELPLDCQSFGQQISAAGTLTGTLTLGDITGNWRGATIPKRTAPIVMRGDQIAWGGWITKRRPTNGGSSAEITAETLEGWLAKQEIQADLTFTNTDVFTIVRGIIAHVAAQAGGNMRIDTDTNLAGYTQTVTYLGKDSTKAGDAISKLAEVSPGFEYTIRWQRTGSVFTPYMTLASPGLSTGLDAIVLEYPGNLIDYDYPEDGTAAPNVLTGVGADSGGTPLLARVEDSTGELAAGVPRLPGQQQMKDETDLTRLTARTTTALRAGLVDYVVPTAVLRGDADPHFGDFPLGIAARLRATSLYHPAGTNGVPGLDVTRRATGWTVVPKAAEQVTLALGSTTGLITPPVRDRTVAAYLRDLDRRVREIATRT
jgi:hypothetical protein